ncbi:hypothetical protein BGX28_006487 [Mortierella sp. GBA30]|nr:hypothetical protein BGX28_006487 [Mortierella sp. GBA30]
MLTPSADSARALTQVVLLAWLCKRYHDLATYASEPLKQRVHFLAKSDGSNLQDLFIWDSPLSSSLLPPWTSTQIQEYIQQHWSADQFPLNPPDYARSWESIAVYSKQLDPETIHALVPIGRSCDNTISIVLTVETENGSNASCWKYHNTMVIAENELQSNGWIPLDDFTSSKENGSMRESSAAVVKEKTDEEGGEDDNDDDPDDDDPDDDYWGQYGDSEDDSGADETKDKSKTNKDPATTADNGLVEDSEDEYWRKYAEQQEEQEREERRKKIMQPASAVGGGIGSANQRMLAGRGLPESTVGALGQINIMDSLRSVVEDSIQSGFSKAEVFEMLELVYETSSE